MDHSQHTRFSSTDLRDEDGNVHAVTNWTKDELKAMPEHVDP